MACRGRAGAAASCLGQADRGVAPWRSTGVAELVQRVMPERPAGRSESFGGEAACRGVSRCRGSCRQRVRHFEVTVRRNVRGCGGAICPGRPARRHGRTFCGRVRQLWTSLVTCRIRWSRGRCRRVPGRSLRRGCCRRWGRSRDRYPRPRASTDDRRPTFSACHPPLGRGSGWPTRAQRCCVRLGISCGAPGGAGGCVAGQPASIRTRRPG